MNKHNIFHSIWNAMIKIGYSRAAYELQHLSDYQLEAAGLSRKQLARGAAGLPWTIESEAQRQTANIVNLRKPEAAKAASALGGDLRLAA